MKRFLLLFIVLFYFGAFAFSQTRVEKKIKNDFLEINDISVERLLQAESDDASTEDYKYQQKIWDSERNLKKA